MTNEQYVEHEVKIRVHEALFGHMDGKFDKIDRRFDKLESKFNWAITLIISGLLLPLVRHYFGF